MNRTKQLKALRQLASIYSVASRFVRNYTIENATAADVEKFDREYESAIKPLDEARKALVASGYKPIPGAWLTAEVYGLPVETHHIGKSHRLTISVEGIDPQRIAELSKEIEAAAMMVDGATNAQSKGGKRAAAINKRRAEETAKKVNARYLVLAAGRNRGRSSIIGTLAGEFSVSERTIQNYLKMS